MVKVRDKNTEVKINFKGTKRTLWDIAKEYELTYNTVLNRHKKGLKDDDLVTKTGKKPVYVEFKGETIELDKVSEQYDIAVATLYYRYFNRGLRDDELVKPVQVNKSHSTYYIDGTPVRMSSKQHSTKSRRKLSAAQIQERLDIGMSMDDALNWSGRYEVKFGSLCFALMGQDSVYYLPTETVATLKDRGVSIHHLANRVKNVEDIVDAVDEPSIIDDLIIYEDEIVQVEDESSKKLQEKARQERIQYYKDKKYRERKPHLFDGTPQVHKWGSYAEYLASSYTFSCKEASK